MIWYSICTIHSTYCTTYIIISTYLYDEMFNEVKSFLVKNKKKKKEKFGDLFFIFSVFPPKQERLKGEDYSGSPVKLMRTVMQGTVMKGTVFS